MKAIIFDFDGVIVNSEKYWGPVENRWFKKILPETWTDEDYRSVTGMNFRDTHQLLTHQFGLDLAWEEFSHITRKMGDEVYEHATVNEGLLSLLDALKNQNFRLAIASSSGRRWIEPMLEKNGIFEAFSAIITGEELPTGMGKPNPMIYLKAAEAIETDPTDCIAIEDAMKGIASAKGAQMYCIAYEHPSNTQDLSAADHTIKHFDEIEIEALQQLAFSS